MESDNQYRVQEVAQAFMNTLDKFLETSKEFQVATELGVDTLRQMESDIEDLCKALSLLSDGEMQSIEDAKKFLNQAKEPSTPTITINNDGVEREIRR